jgi:UDP:flavonoid glycosyltransferase YjiC (YdhE family)
MKITIFAAGSRGDIQPCIVLALGLQQAGHQVRLAAPADFAAFVQQHAIEFHPLRGDVQQLMASDTGRQFMESGGGNPLQSIRAIRSLIAPVIMQMADDAYAACQDAEALLCLGVFSAFGQTIAESLRIPIIHIEPAPLLPARSFPAPSWPIQQNWGGLHNYLSGVLMLQTVWLWYRPFVDAFRRRLGLKSYGPARFLRAFRTTPMLSLYSPTIIPQPTGWPASVHVTGYLFLDSAPAALAANAPEAASGWQPPPQLAAFLAAGEPPVYIGFGSMSGRNPDQLAALVVAALAQCGRRGVLLTGWGGLAAETTPETVFVLEAAPHGWLFPRMAAVVHHGGAGTTAEGLRAGVPAVIVPFVFDQAFWGARVKTLGVGPSPIPQKHLTASRLAQAIETAVTDQGMRQRAAAVGAAVRAEDGLGNAVEAITSILGDPARGKGI